MISYNILIIYIFIILHNNTYTDYIYPFPEAHCDRCRRKLGLKTWDVNAAGMWRQLLELMARTDADYTILFRSLVFCQDWSSNVAMDSMNGQFPIKKRIVHGKHIYRFWMSMVFCVISGLHFKRYFWEVNWSWSQVWLDVDKADLKVSEPGSGTARKSQDREHIYQHFISLFVHVLYVSIFWGCYRFVVWTRES